MRLRSSLPVETSRRPTSKDSLSVKDLEVFRHVRNYGQTETGVISLHCIMGKCLLRVSSANPKLKHVNYPAKTCAMLSFMMLKNFHFICSQLTHWSQNWCVLAVGSDRLSNPSTHWFQFVWCILTIPLKECLRRIAWPYSSVRCPPPWAAYRGRWRYGVSKLKAEL